MKTKEYLRSYLAQFFSEWKMCQAEVVEKLEKHFMFNCFLIVPFMRYVELCCRAGQTTDDNMAHVHCMLDT